MSALAERLQDARVDLLALDAPTEREFLPASHGMLPRAARIHIAAPLKAGKTLGMLAHVVDMIAAGATVAVLDRENGAKEYAQRLRCILDDRDEHVTDRVRTSLAYYAWPNLTLTDGPALAEALRGRDLVVIDSTRTFLTALQLDEDRSDDFARYSAGIVDPLFRAGVTVVQLDNAGHGDGSRARGTSSKGDLADVYFSLKTIRPFDERTRGAIKLKREHSRFGDIGASFVLELGGGHFGTFTHDDQETAEGPFRPTVLMERVSAYVAEQPGATVREIKTAIKGRSEARDLAVDLLVAEGFVERRVEGRSHRHYLLREFRQDASKPPDRPHVPNRPPAFSGDVQNDRPHVPRPYRDGDEGDGCGVNGASIVPNSDERVVNLADWARAWADDEGAA